MGKRKIRSFILYATLLLLGFSYSVSSYALPNEVAYTISAKLDTQTHQLIGKESLTFTNRTGKTLAALYIYLYPNRFLGTGSVYARELGVNDYDLLFPKGPDRGGLLIDSLYAAGKSLSYTIDDIVMRVQITPPLADSDSTTLEINFVTLIPHSLERLGYDQGNYYISWWYPQMAVYDTQGWHTDRIVGVGAAETYQDFARYDVTLTLPQALVVGATGDLQDETENPDDTKTLHYTAENVHDFAWVADARYQLTTVQWQDVTIRSLYWPEDADAGKRAADDARETMAYFSERFGPYPYKNFTVAEIRATNFAMEYPQLIMQTFQIYRLPQFLTLLDEVTAHETAHQWWFGMLMDNEVDETWLDEGFAQFSETAYMEQKYGHKGNLIDWGRLGQVGKLLESFAEQLPNSYGSMLLGPYRRIAQQGREYPILTPYGQVPRGKTALFYQKGALTLYALEYLLGGPTFDKALQAYFQKYRFQQIHTDDFIQTVEAVSGQDLGWFFDEWLRTTKTLDYSLDDLSVERLPDGKYLDRVILSQHGTMQMPVDVESTLQGGQKIRQRWEGREALGALTLLTEKPVISAIIDPDDLLPDINPANNRTRFPLKYSPTLVELGAQQQGHLGDGIIPGIMLSLTDLPGASVTLGYALGSRKPVYRLQFEQPIWFGGQRTSSLQILWDDDGHSRTQRANLTLDSLSSPNRTFEIARRLSLALLTQDRYAEDGDNGRLSSLEFDDRLSLDGRAGSSSVEEVVFQTGLARLGSEFSFRRLMLHSTERWRIGWQTSLNLRGTLGLSSGHAPEEAEKFDIRRDGGFRTFARQDKVLLTLNLDVRFPIVPLNLIEIGPLPFSIGGILFADGGWFGSISPTSRATRAEAGIGLTFGPYGQRYLLRFELPLWINTSEDGGQAGLQGFSFRAGVNF